MMYTLVVGGSDRFAWNGAAENICAEYMILRKHNILKINELTKFLLKLCACEKIMTYSNLQTML